MNTSINVKRIYDIPTESDHYRILVDRLWPRGISKEAAKINYWAKDIAPSNALRKWFHENRNAFAKFKAEYDKELEENPNTETFIDQLRPLQTVTLLTAAKDVAHSHVPVIKAFIQKKAK
ncbi:MAG TPA: DUF488 family protein [Aquaticitalea sp.]|nr:DUF488 family protein [Aquaticitalea sp.]